MPSSRLPPLIHGTTLEVSTIFSRGRCGDHRSGLSFHPPTQLSYAGLVPSHQLSPTGRLPCSGRASAMTSLWLRVIQDYPVAPHVLLVVSLHLLRCSFILPRVHLCTSTSKIACFLYERRWLPVSFLAYKVPQYRPLFPFCEVGSLPP